MAAVLIVIVFPIAYLGWLALSASPLSHKPTRDPETSVAGEIAGRAVGAAISEAIHHDHDCDLDFGD